MSLVHHVDRGPLGDWFRDRGPGLDTFADEVADRAAAAETSRPPRESQREHLATTGAIVGQRIADVIEPAPPYPALMGAVRCQACSPAEASRWATSYPTHGELAGHQRNQAALLRPTPRGWWQLGMMSDQAAEIEPDPTIFDVLRRHARAVRAGNIGHWQSSQDEQQLTPLHYVLSLLEGVYRGSVGEELIQISQTGTVLVPRAVSEDAQALLSHNTHALQQARTLAPRGRASAARLGYAAPTLVPQWAEGDVLLGPDRRDGGFTLVDVKTSLRAHRPGQVRGWIQQLLAYAMLDAVDRWQIRRVALWLPRQGLLVGWPLAKLLRQLGSDEHRVLDEFRALAGRAAHSDGADYREMLGSNTAKRPGR